MKKIRISTGEFALVDDEDFEYLSQFRWQSLKRPQATVYARREQQVTPGRKGRKTVLMHHEIIGRPPKGKATDHINGDGLDNQRHNLRFCNSTQNAANNRQGNTSGYRGVKKHKHMQAKPYEARIYLKRTKKYYYLGCYKTAEEAAKVRDRKAKELWGEFAYLNFPIN